MTYWSYTVLGGRYLIELLIKVFKLRSLCHDFFIHEKWGLNRNKISFGEKIEAILY